jgi:prophage DNA circulation protein
MSAQRMAAAAALTDTASFVETVRAGVVLPDKVSATAAAAVVTLAQTAEAAAESGPGPFVAAALAVLDTIALAATPDQAAPVLQVAAATAVSLVPAVDDAPETTQAAAAIRAALAVAATMQAIRLLSTATYTDRPSAIAARTLIGTIAEAVLPLYGALGPKVTNAFSDLWGQAVTYLTQVITNLKPVVLYEVNLSLPSTVLAYRLYGDPSRATELVARNRVGTPMLMPTLFEALAPN